jgi:YHS domain-containing protein
MEYTIRIADNPDEAHINYQCPCGCTAGLMYRRESGSLHMGACCCGRLLWLGADGEPVVSSSYEAGIGYTLDINSVTLPWGEITTAFLAVPSRSLKDVVPREEQRYADDDGHNHEEHSHPHEHGHDHDHAAHDEHDHDGHDDGHSHQHDHHDSGPLHVDRAATRVRDLVCGMMIEPASAAATSVYKGQTYYFCSAGCKQQFDAEPTRYVKSRGLLARIFGRS